MTSLRKVSIAFGDECCSNMELLYRDPHKRAIDLEQISTPIATSLQNIVDFRHIVKKMVKPDADFADRTRRMCWNELEVTPVRNLRRCLALTRTRFKDQSSFPHPGDVFSCSFTQKQRG